MPYKSDKQRKFMHAQHPGIAARWDKEQKGKSEMPKAKGPKTIIKEGTGGPTKVTRTVARKAAVNYNAGAAATATNTGAKSNQARRAAMAPGATAQSTRKAVRTTIKAGLRTRKPGLSAEKVRGRANKQTAAFMKKRAK